VYSIEGIYSLNLDQPGVVDLNFSNTSEFTAAGENRPIYVPVADILPNGGQLSSKNARRSPRFGEVNVTHSDLRSVSRQAVFTVSPDLSNSTRAWGSVSYVLSSTRAWESGFDGSTFGSPAERSWVRAPRDSRHQFIALGGYGSHGVAFTAFARIRSGTPFTPLIGSDVNGDGRVNDRAYILDPATAQESPAGISMASLITSSNTKVRACLLRQKGTPAAANSCEGPWATDLNALLTVDGSVFHASKRLSSVRLSFANPLAGVDRLLHGNQLRGWGMSANPDPILYYVQGFDPEAKRFLYSVNPRFGATDPERTVARSTFGVTLDFSFYLTPDFPQQQLKRYLGPGRAGRPGERLTIQELKRRYERTVSDPYQAIIAEADSLLISRDQMNALQAADQRYRLRTDSLWTALATDFHELGDRYDVRAALNRQESAIDAAREITRLDVQATLGAILSELQLRLMPGPVRELYRATAPIHRGGRTFYQ
jgi:hypothetical protein